MRAAVVFLLVLAATVALPRASAHAYLESTTPPSNAALDRAHWPSEIVLTFTEAVDASFTDAHLLDKDQHRVEAENRVITAPKEVRVRVPATLPDGLYLLSWKALSRSDGHTTAGVRYYVVGNVSIPDNFTLPSSETFTSSGGAPEATARGVAIAGFFLLAGVPTVVLFLAGLAQGEEHRGHASLRRLATVGAALAAVGAVAAGFLYASRVSEGILATFHALPGTRIGATWLVRMAAAGIALLALLALRKRRSTMWSVVLASGATGLVAEAFASHASGLPYPKLGVLLDAAHLLAGAVWIGGLPALALVMRARDRIENALLIASFSTLATWSVAIVVLSGTVLSLAHLGTFANLWRTPWGLALLAKLALVGVLLVIGALNQFILLPRIRAGDVPSVAHVMRSVSAEIAVAIAVIVAAAILTSNAPPSSIVEAPHASTGAPLVLTAEGKWGTNFTLKIGPTPLVPGLHLVEATLRNATSTVSNANVSVEMTYLGEDLGVSELALENRGNGVYRGLSGDLALAGDWRIEVVSTGRPDTFDERVAFSVTVEA